jgi:hypothetical protein
MIKKDPYLKPLRARPYTPGETWLIGEANPPGAPISGNPAPTQQSKDNEKPHDEHPRP